MISKSLTYLCFMVFFCSYACLALSEIDSKPKYILKCFEDKQDCTILETIPESSAEYVRLYSRYFRRLEIVFLFKIYLFVLKNGNEGIAKRSQLASNDPSSRANLQKLIKRIFPSADVDANQSSRIYKTEHVNCLTGDCSLLTARISTTSFLFLKKLLKLEHLISLWLNSNSKDKDPLKSLDGSHIYLTHVVS